MLILKIIAGAIIIALALEVSLKYYLRFRKIKMMTDPRVYEMFLKQGNIKRDFEDLIKKYGERK